MNFFSGAGYLPGLQPSPFAVFCEISHASHRLLTYGRTKDVSRAGLLSQMLRGCEHSPALFILCCPLFCEISYVHHRLLTY